MANTHTREKESERETESEREKESERKKERVHCCYSRPSCDEMLIKRMLAPYWLGRVQDAKGLFLKGSFFRSLPANQLIMRIFKVSFCNRATDYWLHCGKGPGRGCFAENDLQRPATLWAFAAL